MKPYFAKLLPTKGEIGRGDKYLHPNGCIQQLAKDVSLSLLPEINKKGKLIKLFLCSRDIQVGDKFHRKYTKGTGYTPEMECIGKDTTNTIFYSQGINDEIYNARDLCFKVIGEISPEATWVKEGDEFDEEEWQNVRYADGCTYVDYDKNYTGRDGYFVEIKCPTCKKFH